jgi:dTDP-4-dehydrorhamnose reductase
MKIALTGSTGLVGSRLFDLLKRKYEIIPISSSFGVDITKKSKITAFLSRKRPALIVHLAAKTNVDACEDDKAEDLKMIKKSKAFIDGDIHFESFDVSPWEGQASAFAVNVVGTKNLSDVAKKHGIKMIYLSTDFVFDGEKDGEYTEEDIPMPINWYGQTKYWGEKVLADTDLITRTSFPFGHRSTIKKDLIWTLVDLFLTRESVKLVSDQMITPTFIDDIIRGLDLLIEKQERGLIHVVGNNFLSPYEIGVTVAREFKLRELKIEMTTRKEFYKKRAQRPFNLRLKNDRLKNLGFKMTNFSESLKEIHTDL